MSKVVNKANPTIYSLSANTPEYPTDEWLHDPPGLDGLLTKGIAAKYWKVAGDDVAEMSAAEKTAVDTAEATAATDALKAQATDNPTIVALLQAIATATGKSLTTIKAAFQNAIGG